MLTNSESEIIQGVLKFGPKILEYCQPADDLSSYINRVTQERLEYPVPDKINPENWFIPNSYKNIDIEQFLLDQCPKENLSRLLQELELYKSHGMIDVLKVIKFIVDTLREHKVLWGVGRGSSVASYALFLIGAHKIDSVKYNLPIDEFFKGETNG